MLGTLLPLRDGNPGCPEQGCALVELAQRMNHYLAQP
jgi:hypothetical protein